jgi:AraC family L-rhamnose operon transcriptional activator RhaR
MNWLERLNVRGENELFSHSVAVLHWDYARYLTDNVPHRHTYFEVCLVGAHGAGRFTVDGQQCHLTPGIMFFARPGVIHQIQNTASPAMELFWVAFDVQSVEKPAGPDAELWREFLRSSTVVTRDSGSVAAIWSALQSVAQSAEIAGKTAQLRALREALLLSIIQHGAGAAAPATPLPESEKHGAARLATRYLHDNLGRKIAIEEIAAHVHMSPRHLHRLFRDFTGVSVSTYLETARLDRARHLLLHSSRPIKEIAALLGFESVHYFTRVFSRENGMGPGEFRRAQLAAGRIVQKDGDFV